MRKENYILSAHKVVVREVGYILGNLACLQSSSKIHVVYQFISGEVEKHGTVLHGSEKCAVNHALGSFVGWKMKSDVVADAQHFLKISVDTDAFAAGNIVRVIADDFHTESLCSSCNFAADCTQTYDTKSFAHDFMSCKL